MFFVFLTKVQQLSKQYNNEREYMKITKMRWISFQPVVVEKGLYCKTIRLLWDKELFGQSVVTSYQYTPNSNIIMCQCFCSKRSEEVNLQLFSCSTTYVIPFIIEIQSSNQFSAKVVIKKSFDSSYQETIISTGSENSPSQTKLWGRKIKQIECYRSMRLLSGFLKHMSLR